MICQSLRCRQVEGRCKTMRRTDDSVPGTQLHQVFAQRADLSGSESGAGGAQMLFLIEHLDGGEQTAQRLSTSNCITRSTTW